MSLAAIESEENMEILKAVVLLAIGFLLLVKGADFFVEGASTIARKLHVPGLIIGLTIVAMGTSLPELSVSVTAALKHQNSLAISNVVGSNIINLMMVLGICAVISPIAVSMTVTKRDYPFSMVCAALLGILGYIGMKISRADGAVLLIFMAGYMYIMIHNAMKARKKALETHYEEKNHPGASGRETDDDQYDMDISEEADELTEKSESRPMWQAILFVIGGAAAVKFGGDFTVDGAVDIARMIGISETLIGLTIVACGTSLPELVTSIVASGKNELDMAVGNVVGSNIFNILAILGVGSVITPMAFINENLIDLIVLIVFSAIVWLYCFTKKRIGRKEGASMIVLYTIYLIYICMR